MAVQENEQSPDIVVSFKPPCTVEWVVVQHLAQTLLYNR